MVCVLDQHLGFKVNKYIGVSYNFDLIYDTIQKCGTGGLLDTA
jgi:hypothetical protein